MNQKELELKAALETKLSAQVKDAVKKMPQWDSINSITSKADALAFSEALTPIFGRPGLYAKPFIPSELIHYLHIIKNYPADLQEIFKPYREGTEVLAKEHLLEVIKDVLNKPRKLTLQGPQPTNDQRIYSQEEVTKDYNRYLAGGPRVFSFLTPRSKIFYDGILTFEEAVIYNSIKELNPGSAALKLLPHLLYQAALNLDMIKPRKATLTWEPTPEERLTATALFNKGMTVGEAVRSTKLLN